MVHLQLRLRLLERNQKNANVHGQSLDFGNEASQKVHKYKKMENLNCKCK